MRGCAKIFGLRVSGYLFAVIGVAAVTAVLAPFHERLSSTTVALALLLIILFAATGWGSRPALLAALLGVACFNYFFLPPVHTFTIANPQNWVALTVFLITALVAGELSSRAKRRAEEAEAGRREIERLYNEYRIADERARQAEVFEQSERLKSALLDAVTHDLRTPLTSIKAAVTTLLDDAGAGGGRSTSTMKRGASFLKSSTKRLTDSTISSRTWSSWPASRRALSVCAAAGVRSKRSWRWRAREPKL